MKIKQCDFILKKMFTSPQKGQQGKSTTFKTQFLF